MRWDGPILTDSGGFQVFSLAHAQDHREGVTFASPVDGSKVFLSPEESMRIQRVLDSDVVMIFDECTPYPATEERGGARVDGAVAALGRALQARARGQRRALFGIVQGGVYPAPARALGAD
jgi:queuine tRNA-ribosyltransferase